MSISIFRPHSLSEAGKRLNNEDAIYPSNEHESIKDRLFLVCDGVGGSNKGEVASAQVCESIHTYFDTFLEPDSETGFDPDFIKKAIQYAEVRLDEYLKDHPEAKGMATTLCLLYISTNDIYVTHAGDSRIYQFRNGEIIYQTEDHSLVNSMLRSGQIDAEEARNHPKKNVIYKALQGTARPVDIEVHKLSDIQPEDLFFMCTDGVTESFSTEDLSSLMKEHKSTDHIMTQIKEVCRLQSRDNYSAHLIKIQDVQKGNVLKQVMNSFLYAFI